MKKTTLCVIVFLFGIAINGNAALFTTEDSSISGVWNESYYGYSGDEWSGYLIGLFNENNDSSMQDWVEEYLGYTLTTVNYDKVETFPGTGDNGILTATITEFNDEGEGLSGTWSVVEPYVLGFYSVKGSDNWALYYVYPYESSGTWSTIHLLNNGDQIPTISHLSAIADSAPVPEPATLMLLGAGLIGLAGFRKKLNK